ncbi:MAG: BrnA antitoxin family protein [Pseudobdellovibrionaceae bacterium]
MIKKTIKYSKKDGLEETNFAVSKVRITTMIDKDVLDWLKREAEGQNSRYQTLLNHVLRQAKGSHPDRLSELETRLSRIEKKIS